MLLPSRTSPPIAVAYHRLPARAVGTMDPGLFAGEAGWLGLPKDSAQPRSETRHAFRTPSAAYASASPTLRSPSAASDQISRVDDWVFGSNAEFAGGGRQRRSSVTRDASRRRAIARWRAFGARSPDRSSGHRHRRAERRKARCLPASSSPHATLRSLPVAPRRRRRSARPFGRGVIGPMRLRRQQNH